MPIRSGKVKAPYVDIVPVGRIGQPIPSAEIAGSAAKDGANGSLCGGLSLFADIRQRPFSPCQPEANTTPLPSGSHAAPRFGGSDRIFTGFPCGTDPAPSASLYSSYHAWRREKKSWRPSGEIAGPVSLGSVSEGGVRGRLDDEATETNERRHFVFTGLVHIRLYWSLASMRDAVRQAFFPGLVSNRLQPTLVRGRHAAESGPSELGRSQAQECDPFAIG